METFLQVVTTAIVVGGLGLFILVGNIISLMKVVEKCKKQEDEDKKTK